MSEFLKSAGGYAALAMLVLVLVVLAMMGGDSVLLQAVSAGVLATLVVVPLAMVSAFVMLRMLLRRLDVSTEDLHFAVTRVLDHPQAFAQFLGACVIGVCLLLGQVYR